MTTALQTAPLPALQADACVRFVLDEAHLLNQGNFDAWLALFDVQGRYWVPLGGQQQPDDTLHTSLADEDRYLLATRIRRLKSPAAHSLEPGVRSHHLLQTPVMDGTIDGDACLRTPFLYTESTGSRSTTLAGTWRHRLRMTVDGPRILLKRVDLLDAGAAHEIIQRFP